MQCVVQEEVVAASSTQKARSPAVQRLISKKNSIHRSLNPKYLKCFNLMKIVILKDQWILAAAGPPVKALRLLVIFITFRLIIFSPFWIWEIQGLAILPLLLAIITSKFDDDDDDDTMGLVSCGYMATNPIRWFVHLGNPFLANDHLLVGETKKHKKIMKNIWINRLRRACSSCGWHVHVCEKISSEYLMVCFCSLPNKTWRTWTSSLWCCNSVLLCLCTK